MKRFLPLILAGLMLLCACGKAPDEGGLTEEADSSEPGYTDWEFYDYDAPVSDIDFPTGGSVTMSAEFPVYDRSCAQMSYFITNSSGDERTYGTEYSIYMESPEGWRKIFPTDAGDPDTIAISWTAVAITLPARGTTAGTVKLHSLREGTYRLVKRIGSELCFAEFSIGKSDITAETPYGVAPLDVLPGKYTSELAAENGDLTLALDGAENIEALGVFLIKVSMGVPAFLRVTAYTHEGDAIINDVEYNGRYFTRTRDNTRDKFGVPDVTSDIFSYLITDGENVYLSDCVSYEYTGRCTAAKNQTWLLSGLWCDKVAEICDRNMRSNSAIMTVWAPDGSAVVRVSEDNDLYFTEYSPDRGTAGGMLFLPETTPSGVCGLPRADGESRTPSALADAFRLCGLVWTDDTHFELLAENLCGEGAPYALFRYTLSADAATAYCPEAEYCDALPPQFE